MDEKLIEAVRCFPCLWQTTSKTYKDLRARENAWKEVVSQVGNCTPDQCMKKWKILRDKFVKELKKVKARKSGDAGPAYKPTWRFFDILYFLQDSVRHRETDTNFTLAFTTPPIEEETIINQEDGLANSDTEEVPQLLLSPCPTESSSTISSVESQGGPPPAKRKRVRKGDEIEELMVRNLKDLEERRAMKCDEEEFFGRHVAATLRRFSLRQRAQAKMRIQRVLTDVEFPDEPSEATPPHF